MQYINDESGNIRAYLQEASEMERNAASYKEEAARELVRPFYLIKPKVYPDGDKWCALFGEDIQGGVCGFGDTPNQAAINFDIEWLNGSAVTGLEVEELIPGTKAALAGLTTD